MNTIQHICIALSAGLVIGFFLRRDQSLIFPQRILRKKGRCHAQVDKQSCRCIKIFHIHAAAHRAAVVRLFSSFSSSETGTSRLR